jgi:hypothetical protein
VRPTATTIKELINKKCCHYREKLTKKGTESNTPKKVTKKPKKSSQNQCKGQSDPQETLQVSSVTNINNQANCINNTNSQNAPPIPSVENYTPQAAKNYVPQAATNYVPQAATNYVPQPATTQQFGYFPNNYNNMPRWYPPPSQYYNNYYNPNASNVNNVTSNTIPSGNTC